MSAFVATKRAELRDALDAAKKHGLAAPVERLTSLGMHFIDVDGSPVLVNVAINVPRILAVLGKRLVKSKRGTANLAHGSVRLSVATLEGLEICGAKRS